MYLNPSFDQIVELKRSNPDTLRIIVSDDDVAVASGYCATHTCIMRKFRIRGDDLIFDVKQQVLLLICTDEDEQVQASSFGLNLIKFFDDFACA